MIFATAANVIPLLVSAAPAAPKGLAHTAIIHPDFWADGRSYLAPSGADRQAARSRCPGLPVGRLSFKARSCRVSRFASRYYVSHRRGDLVRPMHQFHGWNYTVREKEERSNIVTRNRYTISAASSMSGALGRWSVI